MNRLLKAVIYGVLLNVVGWGCFFGYSHFVMSKNGSESRTSSSTPSVKTEAPSTGNVAHDRQEWYSGGLSDSTSMSEWTHASNRDQLATAAAIAVMGLELKYGSTRAAVQKLGTMESLLPYAVEVLECMNTAVKGSPDITDADWQKILEKQTVRDFGVGCLAMLKVQGGANSDF